MSDLAFLSSDDEAEAELENQHQQFQNENKNAKKLNEDGGYDNEKDDSDKGSDSDSSGDDYQIWIERRNMPMFSKSTQEKQILPNFGTTMEGS